jgi:hypothetical protein
VRGKNVAERMSRGTERKTDTECWVWTKSKIGNGYGKIGSVELYGIYHRDAYAHRVAWALENGRWPKDGLVIMHTCDNPGCVNPGHLIEGSAIQNSKDRIRTGRWTGIGRGNGKLTLEQVFEIRKSSETQIVLAERYGVSQPTISHVKANHVYTDPRFWPGLDTV